MSKNEKLGFFMLQKLCEKERGYDFKSDTAKYN